jgi:Fic family protein
MEVILSRTCGRFLDDRRRILSLDKPLRRNCSPTIVSMHCMDTKRRLVSLHVPKVLLSVACKGTPLLMRHMDFGQYETTARTIWRSPRERFHPSYREDEDFLADLKATEYAERELGFLREDRSIARKVSEITLEQNVFATLRMAGREVTLDEVRTTLARRPAFRHDGGRTEREMLNTAAFMDRLTEWEVPRAIDDLVSMHLALFDGVDPDAGQIRDRPTFEPGAGRDEVGFVPAMPDRVGVEVRNLLEWLNGSDEPPAVRAALFVQEIQSIQPFMRGNGRLARAAAQVILHRAGCEAIPFVLLDHALYRTRTTGEECFMTAEREGDHTPWVKYYVGLVRETYDGSLRRFRLHQRSQGALNERQWRVAEWFARRNQGQPERRHRFSEVHAAFPDIPERTLQRDLATLRESGILHMEGKWKGARYIYRESEDEPERPAASTPAAAPRVP